MHFYHIQLLIRKVGTVVHFGSAEITVFPAAAQTGGAVLPAAGVLEKRCQMKGSSRPSTSLPLLTDHREEGANQHADWPQLQLHIPEKKKN